ncbi:MAG: aldo/keto reductase [Candidatus Sumerlaeia bacterium]
MLYRKMPNGDELSILGYGCMRFPMRDGGIDEPRAIAQMRSAIDRGVNYLDSAWPYHGGASEVVLGKALRDGYRDRVKVATKLPSWMIQSRADMDRFLNAQLQKLGTDHIDYYLVHSLMGPTWDAIYEKGILDFLDAARRDGRIVNAGFSYHGLERDFSRVVDAYPWVFCQIQYNYLDTHAQAGTAGLRYAASRGLGVVVMEPLRGGNLTQPAPAIDAIWNESPIRRTPAEWALRWVWNHPEVTVVLSGMNDEAQIDENIKVASTALSNALTQDELDLVDRVAGKYHSLLKVGCTGCAYCMPCPSDVLIPMAFEVYNKGHLFGKMEDAKFGYALHLSRMIGSGIPGYASQCTACGACMDKCPQQLPIPDLLAQVEAELEGPDILDRVARLRAIFKNKAT